ncbi:MAG: hypothetical protein PHY09_00020 [Desulfuromonadaceae bacterium]|nr:hypothetical protein [Desulfuromonadaceae bacterium]MDD5105940.1 hypothetical protein [Desulfuromonadaceae bacterium]
MTRWARLLLFCMYLMLTACASQINLNEELDRSVKAYNRMLRWQEVEQAVLTFTAEEQREECLRQAAALKKQGLSVTDFRVLSTQFHPDKKTGDVSAEFDYYILPSNRVKTITNQQQWVYREESKKWKLTSQLPVFE